jgi:hypothetical protein
VNIEKTEGPSIIEKSCYRCKYKSHPRHAIGECEWSYCKHPEAKVLAPKQWPYAEVSVITPDWCPFLNQNKQESSL